MIVQSFCAEDTYEIGKKIGQEAQPGQVICLYGDLGVGKTVFTKGLADGLGITEPIQSPTFTIVREYEEGRLPLYHFDVYRIGDIEEMDEIGYEAYLEKRVADALECVEGVGKTEVVITLKSSGQKVIEKDQISNSRTTTEEDSAGGTRGEKEGETEKTSIYEQREDGSQTPYVSREMLPEVEGVAVIAEGGDHPVVVQNITEAIQALFGIEAHKIKIMKRTTAGS